MKKKVRLLSIIGALTLCSIGLAGCGGEEGGSGETKSLSYWVPMEKSIATRVKDYNDVEMYKQREADSGIHMEFIHPAIGQETEQFNLMVASGDLPDLVEFKWTNYNGGVQRAIDDGIIIPLNDYIDKYAPNFKKLISDGGKYAEVYDKGSKTDSGEYFAFPCFNTGDIRTFGGPMIRKDWLDELGLEVPETMDDWTTVLRAFKEKKGAVAPLTGVANYFTGGDNSFNGAYNVGKRLYLDGDKVQYGPLQSEYKEYLKIMNQWYSEGLLDKDFATNKSAMVDANITMGNSGALMGYLGSGMGRYLSQMKNEDPNFNLVCAPYPVLEDGGQNNFYLSEGDVGVRYLAITKDCKDPVAAVKWIDYLYSEEGYNLVNFGIEGKTYNMVDGKPVYTDEIMNNPEGLSINEALCLHCRATAAAPGLKQAPEYLEQYYEFPQQVDGFKLWSENTDGAGKTKMPEGVSATSEESGEIAVISADLNTYVEEMSFKFIIGEKSFDEYDDFVQTLKTTFKADRFVEIYQQMYNRYLER